MSRTDRVELYADKLIERLESSIVPTVGSYISIKGMTYSVAHVSYSVDSFGNGMRNMRANVELIPCEEGEL